MPQLSNPPDVAVLGAAFSANKGAAAMLHAVLDRLPERLDHAPHFWVLTNYPAEDRTAAAGRDDVTVVAATPPHLVVSFLLALVVWLLRRVGNSGALPCRTGVLRALRRADVAVDVAGISFVDGRGPALLAYNVILTSLPLLMGCPTVKASQALGPFQQTPTRLAARAVLPQARTVCARGPVTRGHVDGLGLDNVVDVPDLAFLLAHDEADAEQANRLLGVADGQSLLGVNPSEIVARYAADHDIDYLGALEALVRHAAGDGWVVRIFPHSVRPGRPASRMNDLPLCERLAQRVNDVAELVAADPSPHVLRALVARCDALVTGRFHAMVSALATDTPVLVIGWSHKYAEVMAEFGVDGHMVAYRDLSTEGLPTAFDTLNAEATEVASRIARAKPAVTQRAWGNLDAVADAIGWTPQ